MTMQTRLLVSILLLAAHADVAVAGASQRDGWSTSSASARTAVAGPIMRYSGQNFDRQYDRLYRDGRERFHYSIIIVGMNRKPVERKSS